MRRDKQLDQNGAKDEDIAIVGMAVDVPGASDLAAFWNNLRDGIESIVRLDGKTLIDAGEDPALIAQPNYVPVAAPLSDFDMFDAEFFGFSPKEAAILDPQHRKFLETSWHALENAGHAPEKFPGNIGVYAGCGMGSYFYFNICTNPDMVRDTGMFLLRHTGNDKDFLSTRVSHVFDLRGPSINVQTACSTSLVAVHYALRALQAGDCDMALAGGVTIELPQNRGYLYRENELLSPDGHCHAFDHRAQGTVFGSGAGTVVLRRLSDALADGDTIYAVVKGSAINNDGASKAGYLAPSVNGQKSNILAALADAGVEAETIDYVECHGTGTYLGDPIEVSALTEAYRASTENVGYCGIGSVKTNIGHLDTAAGVASLVKTAMGLHNKQIPPNLSYEAPNPAINFKDSPFFVNEALRPWTTHSGPRRAGVNALGVGGTNAHVILEEAPERPVSEESDFPFQVLCVSGHNRAALEANSAALAAHLRAHSEQPLADIAYTLKEGRRGFDKRRVVVAESHQEAAGLLESGDATRVFTHERLGDAPDVVFMFPGGGAQYPDMARDLYETEPVFAEWMDRGLDHLTSKLDYDIRAVWLPDGPEEHAAASDKLRQPSVQLPLIMMVEYAMAKLWQSWNINPSVLVGHSMGENTAACLAGVIGFEDCIDLVLLRGRLFDTVAPGGMLSVALPVEELKPLIGKELDIAAVNAPELSAVSGPQGALDKLSAVLTARGVEHQRIAIDIAAHSRMLDPILPEFRAFLQSLKLSPPKIPFVSNNTGKMISAAQATDPEYWVRQLRQTIMFGDCIETLTKPDRVFLEVGPGKALSTLAKMAPRLNGGQIISSLRRPEQDVADDAFFFSVIGRLWACGVEADWPQIWGEARRNRVPLPNYAFQRSRYFIEPGQVEAGSSIATLPMRNDDLTDWSWKPVWQPRYAEATIDGGVPVLTRPETWLVFEDDAGFAAPVIAKLNKAGHKVIRVTAGDSFRQIGPDHFALAPEQSLEGMGMLFATLAETAGLPTRIAHFWLATRNETFRPGSDFFTRNTEHGLYALVHLAQSLAEHDTTALHIDVFTTGAAQVAGTGLTYPEKAMITGPLGVMPREFPGMTCAMIDVGPPQTDPSDALTTRILAELAAKPRNFACAYHGHDRFEETWIHARIPAPQAEELPVDATYVITGGFGGIGQAIARDIAARGAARIALVSRSADTDRPDRRAALNALEQSGAQVMVVAADVGNLGDMQRLRSEVETRFGTIDCVIHGAGEIHDQPILAKTTFEIETVLGPKVSGLRVIDEVFPDGDLKTLILFSSSSTITHPAGQVDYIAANAFLDAFAQSRIGSKTRVVAVNWGVWGDTGMAADAMARRLGQAARPEMKPTTQPVLNEMGTDSAGGIHFSGTLSTRNWVIGEHRTKAGDALLPGTGHIELVAQAMAALSTPHPYRIEDLTFLQALDVPEGTKKGIRLLLTPKARGYGVELRSTLTLKGLEASVLHSEARISLLGLEQKPGHIDTRAIARRCSTSESADSSGRLVSPQEAYMNFGSRWHVLRSTAYGKGEGIAHLSLPKNARADLRKGWVMHPALLDLATGWAMKLVPGYQADGLWVPLSYGEITIYRSLPAELISWVRLSGGSNETGFARFDISLCAPDGTVHADIKGFQMKKLESTSFARPLPVTEEIVDFEASDADRPPSAEEEALFHNIRQGIRATEGADALRRAMASGLPRVAMTALSLDALVAQAEKLAKKAETRADAFDRPELDSDFVAPRTAIEEKLADFWRKLLGVAQVGVDDNFFDLGGHSLIAVRLFTMIKREYSVEFPISVLFEAPTIARCAALIAAERGEDGSDNSEPDPDARPSGTGLAEPNHKPFIHVVTLSRNEAATGTPMFIVAGMFGNVLNLRHVALEVGRDRPVYGLQARGLIGDMEPHTRIEDAARDCISEMRLVQPDGPYFIGGFSGGGITALEIAQQLHAAGQEVGLLTLFDTPLPVRPKLSRYDKVLMKLSEFRQKGPGYFREWMQARRDWHAHLARQKADTPEGGFNNQKIERAYYQAVESYTVAPYDGSVLLLRPPLEKLWKVSGGIWVDSEREYVYHDNQWGQYMRDLEVVEVSGDHDSMVLVPHVRNLAAELRSRLTRADGTTTQSAPRKISAA